MDWSSDLVSKLESESLAVDQQLATLNPTDSLPAVKVHAERKLLALTPQAIDVLGDGMSAGLTKDRIAAASKVLELSPATRTQTTFSSEQSIPVEALKTIFEAMGKMFNLRNATHPIVADPPSFRIVKEEAYEAPDQPLRTDRRTGAVVARWTAVRSDDAVHGDGLPSQEVVSEPSAEGSRRPKQLEAKHRKGTLK